MKLTIKRQGVCKVEDLPDLKGVLCVTQITNRTGAASWLEYYLRFAEAGCLPKLVVSNFGYLNVVGS